MEKPRGKTPLHIIETLANLCDDDNTLHEKKTTTTTCFNTSVDIYSVSNHSIIGGIVCRRLRR